MLKTALYWESFLPAGGSRLVFIQAPLRQCEVIEVVGSSIDIARRPGSGEALLEDVSGRGAITRPYGQMCEGHIDEGQQAMVA
jgi:hypothetical protein